MSRKPPKKRPIVQADVTRTPLLRVLDDIARLPTSTIGPRTRTAGVKYETVQQKLERLHASMQKRKPVSEQLKTVSEFLPGSAVAPAIESFAKGSPFTGAALMASEFIGGGPASKKAVKGVAGRAAKAVKLVDEIDLAGQKIARYETPQGEAWVTYRMGDEGKLEVINIGAQGGARSLGVSGVRAIRDDLTQRTGATSMAGHRTSGSSIGRDAGIVTRKPTPGSVEMTDAPVNVEVESQRRGGVRGTLERVGSALKRLQPGLSTEAIGAGRKGPFYSRLERAIGAAPNERATGQQWTAAVSKNVSAAEREATGIDKFLAENKDRTLTRAEVQDYFDKNRFEISRKDLRDDRALDTLTDERKKELFEQRRTEYREAQRDLLRQEKAEELGLRMEPDEEEIRERARDLRDEWYESDEYMASRDEAEYRAREEWRDSRHRKLLDAADEAEVGVSEAQSDLNTLMTRILNNNEFPEEYVDEMSEAIDELDWEKFKQLVEDSEVELPARWRDEFDSLESYADDVVDRQYAVEEAQTALDTLGEEEVPDSIYEDIEVDEPDFEEQARESDWGDLIDWDDERLAIADDDPRLTVPDEDVAEGFDRYVEEYQRQLGSGAKETQYGTYTEPGGRRYTESLFNVDPRFGPYASPHFQGKPGSQNLMFHTRAKQRDVVEPSSGTYGTRYDPYKPEQTKGTATHIDEIQSDWIQAMRDRGALLAKEREQALSDFDTILRETANLRGQEYSPVGESDRYREIQGIYDEYSEMRRDVEKKIPAAPVSKLDDYLLLGIKNALEDAVKRGDDFVAWTPGEMQALRYRSALVQATPKVAYDPASQQLYTFSRHENAGPMLVYDQQGQVAKIAPDALRHWIGKENADLLLATPLQSTATTPMHELSAENFNVGGAGMRFVYDERLPKLVQDYTKKMGAPVELQQMRFSDTGDAPFPGFKIPPALREKILREGQPLLGLLGGAVGLGAAAGGWGGGGGLLGAQREQRY